MLLVDPRDGSKELFTPLQAAGLPVELVTIDADLAFIGKGYEGKSVDVGVEFKTLNECVAAMRTERLQGVQAPRMVDVYDYRYLLVEGELLFNKTGQLMRRAGKRTLRPLAGSMTLGEFLKRIHVLFLCSGMVFIHSHSRRETIRHIEALYRVWTDTNLDEHKSHLGVYSPPTPVPINEFRRAVMQWPGIGFRTSLAVEQKFNKSIRRASLATVQDWASITTTDERGRGRRFGEKAAQRIVTFLEG
jgi:ERCC4-type nuclease